MLKYQRAQKAHIRSGIEVVITALTRNQVVRKGSWVRIPPAPPEKDRFQEKPVFFNEARLRRMKNEAGLRPMKRASAHGWKERASLHGGNAAAICECSECFVSAQSMLHFNEARLRRMNNEAGLRPMKRASAHGWVGALRFMAASRRFMRA